MQNIFNKDFQDFIGALNKFDVEYILVGLFSNSIWICQDNRGYGYMGK